MQRHATFLSLAVRAILVLVFSPLGLPHLVDCLSDALDHALDASTDLSGLLLLLQDFFVEKVDNLVLRGGPAEYLIEVVFVWVTVQLTEDLQCAVCHSLDKIFVPGWLLIREIRLDSFLREAELFALLEVEVSVKAALWSIMY